MEYLFKIGLKFLHAKFLAQNLHTQNFRVKLATPKIRDSSVEF